MKAESVAGDAQSVALPCTCSALGMSAGLEETGEHTQARPFYLVKLCVKLVVKVINDVTT